MLGGSHIFLGIPSLTKFRIKAHRQKIERGRFLKPPKPVENRVCDHCLFEAEDEFHFLISCSRYNTARNYFFSVVEELQFIRREVKIELAINKF